METNKVTQVAERLQWVLPMTKEMYDDVQTDSAFAGSIEQIVQRSLSELADKTWPDRVGRIEYDSMEYQHTLFPYVSDDKGNTVKVPEYAGIMYAKVWVLSE